MKKKLTDLYIKSAKAQKGTRLDVYDEKATGLMLRVTDKGNKSFSFKYDVPGTRKQIRVTIGNYPEITLDKARDLVDGYRADLKAGKDPRLEKVAKVTVSSTVALKKFYQVADEYIEKYSKPNLDSWKNDVQLLRRPRDKWGRRPFASISDDEAMEFLEGLAEDAPVQANRTQSKLYQLWKWAKLPGRKYVKINVFEGLPAQGQEHKRDRVLDDSEIKTLWVGLEDPDCPGESAVKGALKLILSTMVRPGQASGALVCVFR